MKNVFLMIGLVLSLSACKQTQKEDVVAGDKATEKFVRKNAHSEEAKADLEAMEKAFGMMRSMGCTEPISWYYQGAIHSVPLLSDDPEDDQPKTPNSLCESFQFNASQLKTAWANCTHDHSQAANLNFLLWHRLYIWHLEKIVRELSGKKDFALPYWGYTNTENIELNRTLPGVFRNPKSTLFEKARYQELNDGKSISAEFSRNLDLSSLFDHQDFATFANNINEVPHGAMHDYIGVGDSVRKDVKYFNSIYNKELNEGLMAYVESAGFDPIFWLHHANIDRIWQQWTNSEKGKEVCLDSLKKYAWPNYTFFDGKGKQVNYTIEEVYNIIYNGMDYTYDDTEVKGKNSITECKPSLKAQGTPMQEVTPGKANIKVSKNATEHLLVNRVFNSPTLLKAASSLSNRYYLTFDVEIPEEGSLRGTFEVYLNLPKNVVPIPSDKYFCGFMNFFGSNHKHHHHAGHDAHTGPSLKKFRFDVTDEIRDTDAFNKKEFKLTFPDLGENELTIRNVQIVKQ